MLLCVKTQRIPYGEYVVSQEHDRIYRGNIDKLFESLIKADSEQKQVSKCLTRNELFLQQYHVNLINMLAKQIFSLSLPALES